MDAYSVDRTDEPPPGGRTLLWPVYLITLQPEAARCLTARRQLARERVPYTLFDAVDGEKLAAREIDAAFDAARNRRIYKYPLTRPEIGCYLSHVALWRRIAAAEEPGAIVLEDDFRGADGFGALLGELCERNWSGDLISFHQSRRSIHRGMVELPCGYSVVEPMIAPARTTGYLISREAARRLVARGLPFARPVDIDLKHWWESGIRFLSLYPSALWQAKDLQSSIGPSRRRARNGKGPVVRLLRNLRYQVRYHLMLAVARIRRMGR